VGAAALVPQAAFWRLKKAGMLPSITPPNAQAADEVVQQVKAAGGRAIAVQADVANEEQVLAMFKKCTC